MGANFHQLLLQYKVWWLSQGKVFTRSCDLREVVLLFLADINTPLVRHMEEMNWVEVLAYLSDIFNWINTLNTPLQGKDCSVFLARYDVSAFRKKFYLWCARVEQGLVEMFSTLEDVGRAGLQLDTVLQGITVHLKGLHEQIGEYFGEETLAKCVWGPNCAEL